MDAEHYRRHQDYIKQEPPEQLYIALEGYDFSFLQCEIDYVLSAWPKGESIDMMAEKLMRPVAEIFILCLDLAEKQKIKRRAGAIWGAS